MGTTYRIYPAIGIARLGNSPDEYFVGPEAPGRGFVPSGGVYRDGQQRIRRQAARFRVYECTFDEASPELITPVREITETEATVSWTVQLANTKAADDGMNTNTMPRSLLEIKADDSIQGINQSRPLADDITFTDDQGHNQTANVKLGDLRTDDAGRLVVLGGHGTSASPTGAPISGLHSDGWYDDASDGKVTATIRLHGSPASIDAESAWVIVGPPAYAHPIFNVVTLFDLALDIGTRLPTPNNLVLSSSCSFTKDIYPVLQRAVGMQWTSFSAMAPHGFGRGNFLEPGLFQLLHDLSAAGSAQARSTVFDRLKDPANGGSGFYPRNMPSLAGLSLTPTQYERFRQWRDGNYVDDWVSEPPEPSLDQIPIADQPAALTRAALEAGVGGSFQPGIECSQKFAAPATFQTPFRISPSVMPGDLTQELSVPWQADFAACGRGWWPGGRPNFVMNAGGQRYNWVPPQVGMREMVTEWNRLGFIASDDQTGTRRYVEQERLI